MRVFKLALLALFQCGALTSFSQQQKLDSLRQQLRGNLPDTVRARVLVTIAELYRMSHADSTMLYAGQVFAFPDKPAFYFYKAHAYNSLGYATYFKAQYQQSIAAFRQYYAYAAKRNDKVNMAYGLINEGNIHIELGDYGKALDNYRRALALQQDINYTAGIAMSYNNIGFIYKDLGDYEKATANFLFALREFEKQNDKQAIATTYNYLGAISLRQKNYPEAIDYQTRALAMQQSLQDKSAMGISYASLANIYGEQQQFEKALEYNLKAQSLHQALQDDRQLGLVKSSIAELYKRQQDYRKALPYHLEAIALYRKISNTRSLAAFYISAASTLIALQDLLLAKAMLDSAQQLTQKVRNKEHIRDLYKVQAEFYAASGDYRQALQSLYRFTEQKDTLLNDANIKSLTDMKVKYETEKKEQQIALLNKDNAMHALRIENQQLQLEKNLFALTQSRLQLTQANLGLANNKIQIQEQQNVILQQRLDATEKARNILELQNQTEVQKLALLNQQLQVKRRNIMLVMLAAVSVLGGLLGYSSYRRYKLKQEAKMHAAILRQQEEATSAVIAAEEAERQRIAKDLHDGVGQIMSAVKMNLSVLASEMKFTNDAERADLDRILSLVDDSCKEVRSVSHNMMPNALLKNSLAAAVREFISKLDHKKLKVHLYTEGLEERLNANVESVLYRVIQECVNNVIKHSQADTLDISIIRDANEVTATVEDNGRGFDINDKKIVDGIGLKNIRTRVEYLKGTVDFDTAPGKGTVVALYVPL